MLRDPAGVGRLGRRPLGHAHGLQQLRVARSQSLVSYWPTAGPQEDEKRCHLAGANARSRPAAKPCAARVPPLSRVNANRGGLVLRHLSGCSADLRKTCVSGPPGPHMGHTTVDRGPRPPLRGRGPRCTASDACASEGEPGVRVTQVLGQRPDAHSLRGHQCSSMLGGTPGSNRIMCGPAGPRVNFFWTFMKSTQGCGNPSRRSGVLDVRVPSSAMENR